MALHEQSVGATSEWYTPPHVFKALGCSFDMDVASPGPAVTHWIPATRFYTSGSLERDWEGFLWMNSPFGGRNGLVPWLEKFFDHGDGIALTPDRTSAPWWQQYAPRADLVLFVAPKLKFIGADGKPGESPAQGTCLLAAGAQAVEALHRAAANGLGSLFSPSPSRWAGSMSGSVESRIETAFLKALRGCGHPSALAARLALNEIPRPLWDQILDATAAVVAPLPPSCGDR